VTLSDTTPYASSEFADIWKGQRDGNQVCVKAFRTQTAVNLEKDQTGVWCYFDEGKLGLMTTSGSIVT
jgi:hypothetical protein